MYRKKLASNIDCFACPRFQGKKTWNHGHAKQSMSMVLCEKYNLAILIIVWHSFLLFFLFFYTSDIKEGESNLEPQVQK